MQDMDRKDRLIAAISESFRDTHHPGDAFLQGSDEGCEPGEAVAPFRGVAHWSKMDADTLDQSYTALSFLSEGGFRYFLPAYLIADLNDRLQTADPVFHLTHGFADSVVRLPAGSGTVDKRIGKSVLLNPRRYGAMTHCDYARYRLCVFTREESGAIVSYLEYKRDADPHGINRREIDAALTGFWRDRAAHAPEQRTLSEHLKQEENYVKALNPPQ